MKRLQLWLDTSGTSKADLAGAVGVKPPTLSEWISGDCLPSASSLILLSRFTKLTVDELLEGCEPSPTRRGIQKQAIA